MTIITWKNNIIIIKKLTLEIKLIFKPTFYIEVKEYWMANPESEVITIYNFENKTNNEYSKSNKLVSDIFNEIEINLTDIIPLKNIRLC